MSPRRPSDDDQRTLAVRARGCNLLVDAGAGTGKTRLVVDRLLEMIAPIDDGDAYSLERIAAITFTRRAAGELRLRIRELLLSRLADPKLSPLRRERLLGGLGMLDTAFIGTIHSFADRLLRQSPVEADLGPSYDVIDDDDELVQEAYLEMLQAAQAGTLSIRFAGTELAPRAGEVEETLVGAIEAGLLPQTRESETHTLVGLDRLVGELLRRRDAPAGEPQAAHFEDASFRSAVERYLAVVRPLEDGTVGERWMQRFGARLREAVRSSEPKILFDLLRRIDAAKKELRKTIDFGNGSGRDAWTAFESELSDALASPIKRWMASRLVRTAPVALACYEDVKRRRRTVDTVDLLDKLARVMRHDLSVRAKYQSLFDHVFVDEFQDTDPLQAEIILYLAEREARATTWKDVVLGAGRLTLVGDPKQSIYRFRRADVVMYEAVHAHVAKQDGSLSITLRDNFRSVPSLVDWYNETFGAVLGTSSRTLDASTGQVYYRSFSAFREASRGRPVHVLPLEAPAGGRENAADLRALEGEAVAEYIRSLVEKSDIKIDDAHSKTARRLRYGDITVLGLITTQLHALFRAFDARSVPYTAAGGTLFLNDALHRQFILGLRALSDPEDGVAEAALLRPPFFAIDLWDVLQARAPAEAARDEVAGERGKAALELVRTLRRERFDRPPGATARRLLEETAFGRLVALGPNGEQRLRHLRELCAALEQRAAEQGLDFDGVTAQARSWIDWPIALDPARPVWSDAVQVMSVHQAKGLEFPVVIVWDASGKWQAIERAPIYALGTSSRHWALNVHGLKWQEPAGTDLLERAQEQANWERRRLVYVAATRAQEVLVIPYARGSKFDDGEKFVNAMLAEASIRNVELVAPYSEANPPSWVVPPVAWSEPIVASALAEETQRSWDVARAAAQVARYRPAAVSVEAKELARLQCSQDPEQTEIPRAKRREGRFGPVFGETVHRAIGQALIRGMAPRETVARCARATGLTEYIEDAVGDVERALEALERERITAPGAVIRVEYPVAALTRGVLVAGYVDLLAVTDGQASVVDFKTDRAPAGSSNRTHPEYVEQVQAYVQLLSGMVVGIDRKACGALLWTESGRIEWI